MEHEATESIFVSIALIGAGMELQFTMTKSHFISVTLKHEQGLDFVEDSLLGLNEALN